MRTKKNHENYLLIDNRASGDGMLEQATITCSHCQRGIIINPLRQRERGYCPKCDHYVCDFCTGQPCVTMDQLFDELRELAVRGVTLSDDTVRDVKRKLTDG